MQRDVTNLLRQETCKWSRMHSNSTHGSHLGMHLKRHAGVMMANLLVSGRHRESVVQEQLDSGHYDSGVGVAEPVVQHIHEVIHLLLP